ncbi:MAG: peptide chain release factor N(5)-glutamine methyltransferase [Clostridia bacterium]|nr:peptide chain release factor N(5)-glutamine methyltransferase [Clostridia bacterium]
MVNKLLFEASKRLCNSDTPMLDARVLLAKAANVKDSLLIFRDLSKEEKEKFEKYISLREKGVPVSYITGEKEFMGYSFRLNKDTLIPRPDTECLVEAVLEVAKPQCTILDLCTGSGCIGISLVKKTVGSTAVLCDISQGALEAARENAESLGVKERIKVIYSDVLTMDFVGKYDIITANPPYIESNIVPTLAVSKFEPHRALDGGKDGLCFYRAIAKKAYNALNDGGILAFEIGYNQAKAVSELMGDYKNVTVKKDYAGNDRVVIGYK